MNRHRTKKERRIPVNLSLTTEAIAMLETLKTAMNRPSKSNTVEALVHDKAKQLKVLAA